MSWTGFLIALVLLAIAYVFVRTALKPAVLAPEASKNPASTGYAVMLCYRELSGNARQSLELTWGAERARLVKDNRGLAGYRSYAQVHRVSRWHIVSVLLQLSRSWPIVAVGSILHGLPVNSPRFLHRQRKLEAWDMVEIFNFDSSDKALSFLQSPDLDELRARLNKDASQRTSYRQAIPLQITTALDQSLSSENLLLNLFFLRAREHLGRKGMLDYWLQQHRPFALQQQPVLQYHVYHQYIARETELLEAAAGSLSSDSANNEAANNSVSWDGVASVGFPDMSYLLNGIPNPRVQVANFRLVWDEIRFIDIKRSSLVLGHVRHSS